jgi:hypothetical protein
MGKMYEQTLHQKRNMNGKEHKRRCSLSLVIREMQIKTTMKHIQCLILRVTERDRTTKCWGSCAVTGILSHIAG